MKHCEQGCCPVCTVCGMRKAGSWLATVICAVFVNKVIIHLGPKQSEDYSVWWEVPASRMT